MSETHRERLAREANEHVDRIDLIVVEARLNLKGYVGDYEVLAADSIYERARRLKALTRELRIIDESS